MFLKKENELDFTCQSCGNCCRHFNINLTHLDIERILENRPDLTTDDFIKFAPSDKGDNESFISTYGKRQIILKKKKEKNECVFLENNICSIHNFKPRVCKVWPFSLEAGNKISWIKEHKGFIKKSCKHTSIPGANDPDEILSLLKQHYKERKLFSKLTNKWNDLKKELLNNDEMFIDIYDNDFLDFILKEMNIRVQSEDEINSEEDILVKIINVLIRDRRINAITHSNINDIYSNDRNNDLNFSIYLKESGVASFFSYESLNDLKLNLEADIYIHDDRNNKILFLIDDNFLDLEIKLFSDLKNPLDCDTKVIYNPYGLELNIKSLYDQTKEELLKNYNLFWIKVLKIISYMEKGNILDAKFLFNSVVNIELSSLVFWLNKSKFTLNDINTLDYKNKDLKDFMINFDSNKTIIDLKASVIKIMDIFDEIWRLTGLEVNQDLEIKVREKIINLT